MNILMMSLLYPDDQLQEATRNAKDKIQNQINNYQHAFISGIRRNLTSGETLHIVNALPVGVFPLQYRQLFLRSGRHDNESIQQLGCINLPWIKQRMRAVSAARALCAWAAQSRNNRTVLVYTQYLPYLRAIQKVKKRFPDLKAAIIVTDLPNEWGLASGRKGLMKKLEQRMGRQSLQLCKTMDGFILLTEPMADVIGVTSKPYLVMEGLILEKSFSVQPSQTPKDTGERASVLYTGTLEPDLGIGEMLEAFAKLPDLDLWICGQGSMKPQVEKAAQEYPNIHYYGLVSQNEALALQMKASALINPRQPNGAFTRYSFPSKTLEYLRSGKPVLCCKLEGIPADYDPYLMYMEPGVSGVHQAVKHLFSLSEQERETIGQSGKRYVLEQKNPKVQCEKLVRFLRRL